MRLEFTACTPGADGGDEDDDKNADVTGIDGANTADDDDTEGIDAEDEFIDAECDDIDRA